MTHLAAFKCAVCPRNNDPELGPSCPAWWETVQTNAQTGEMKLWKSCAWEQLPYYLVRVIEASNRPAAAVESMRNETLRGLSGIADVLIVERNRVREGANQLSAGRAQQQQLEHASEYDAKSAERADVHHSGD